MVELELDLGGDDFPDNVAAFLVESERRIDELFDTERNKKVPKYIPSDSKTVYRAIASLSRDDLPLGNVFCEWGSGFGVASSLAGLLGYEAYGIEIEPVLVEAAQSLAKDLETGAQFVRSSFIPEGFDSYEGVGADDLVVSDAEIEIHGYEGMEPTLEEVDVFFIYPWPGEQEMVLDLFKAVAVEGAIVIVYYEAGDIAA